MGTNDRRARATEEATQWWTRLGTQAPAEVSETDRQEFTLWLRESPLHVAELLHVAHVHDALERFKLWDEITPETQSEHNNITALPSFSRMAGEGARGEDHRRGGGHRTRFFLAASAALIAIASGWLALRSGATTIETDRAERREVVLADGSVVNLAPETALRVNFSVHQRYVVLTRGRALFHVAKDAARPFIVHAGDTNVRAVGTIFGVEQKNQNIIVTVSEGKVAVVPSASEASLSESHSNETLSASGASSSREEREASLRTVFPRAGSGGSRIRGEGSATVERRRKCHGQRSGRRGLFDGRSADNSSKIG